jgi:hypothetical protein
VAVARIEVRRLLPVDAALYRDVRLEALRRSPEAFGSTFETEHPEALTWFADRLESSAVFGAFDGIDLVGTAGFLSDKAEKRPIKGFSGECMFDRRRERPASENSSPRR